MAVVIAQSNNASVSNVSVGRASGTYTAADFTITLGFKPRYFRIINLTDRVQCEWFEGMAAGDCLLRAANGDTTLVTTDGITVNADGTVSVDVSVNGIMTDNDDIAWYAVG